MMAMGARDEVPRVSAANAGIALGSFLRQLTTRSRWDRFLEGEEDALSAGEKMGLATFVAAGCISCQQYRTVGGGTPSARTPLSTSIKVPGLLNVEKTAPYYHDGSIATLEESIDHMARVQLGRQLTVQQIDSIATFLRCLTGDPPAILSDR